MKKFLWASFLAICVMVFTAGPVSADWNKCKGCHTGSIAPAKEALKEKFKTLDDFVKGAMATENPMMKGIKKDPDGIQKAAKEIGYTNPENKKK